MGWALKVVIFEAEEGWGGWKDPYIFVQRLWGSRKRVKKNRWVISWVFFCHLPSRNLQASAFAMIMASSLYTLYEINIASENRPKTAPKGNSSPINWFSVLFWFLLLASGRGSTILYLQKLDMLKRMPSQFGVGTPGYFVCRPSLQAKRRMEEERMAQLEKYREDYEAPGLGVSPVTFEGVGYFCQVSPGTFLASPNFRGWNLGFGLVSWWCFKFMICKFWVRYFHDETPSLRIWLYIIRMSPRLWLNT